MSHIDPNDCSFCYAQFNSPICTLPFKVIHSIPIRHPDFHANVQSLHFRYGIEALSRANNFQAVLNSATQSLMTQAPSIRSSTSYYESSVSGSSNPPASSRPEDEILYANSQYDEPSQTLPPQEKSTPKLQHNDIPSVSSPAAKSPPLSTAPVANAPESQPMTQSSSGSTNTSQSQKKAETLDKFPDISDDIIDHIAIDVSYAMIFAYLMQNKIKGHYRYSVSELIKNLSIEYKIVIQSGSNYRKSEKATLDHPIGLAKTICWQHAFESIRSWNDGETSELSNICIFNHANFSSSNTNAKSEDLINELILYSNRVLKLSGFSKRSKDVLLELVISNIASQNVKIPPTWLDSQINLIRQQKSTTKKTLNKGKLPQIRKPQANEIRSESGKPDHVCPSLSPKVEQLIANKLKTICTDVIKTLDYISMNNETDFSDFDLLVHTVDEFIHHTEHWNASKFYQSTDVFVKLTPNLQFELTDISVPKLRLFFNRVLDAMSQAFMSK